MTEDPKKLNLEALAAMGWTDSDLQSGLCVLNPDGGRVYGFHLLYSDLNAMAEAEKWLEKELGDLFLYRGRETNRKQSVAYWGLARVPQKPDDDNFGVVEVWTDTECLARLEALVEVLRWLKEQTK